MSSRPLPRWSDVVGVFGGAFDPPHLGHLVAARTLIESPGLKKLIVLPAAVPPHKKAIAEFQDRFQMTKLTFEPIHELVHVSEFEAERSQITGLPNYSYDTLSELRRDGAELAFVIGSDQLLNLHKWFKFPDVISLCHWIILDRHGETHELALQLLGEWKSRGLISAQKQTKEGLLYFQENAPYSFLFSLTEAPPISSTMIREGLAKSGSIPRDSMVAGAESYLMAKGLYGYTKSSAGMRARSS